jgi:hypothetical protein
MTAVKKLAFFGLLISSMAFASNNQKAFEYIKRNESGSLARESGAEFEIWKAQTRLNTLNEYLADPHKYLPDNDPTHPNLTQEDKIKIVKRSKASLERRIEGLSVASIVLETWEQPQGLSIRSEVKARLQKYQVIQVIKPQDLESHLDKILHHLNGRLMGKELETYFLTDIIF